MISLYCNPLAVVCISTLSKRCTHSVSHKTLTSSSSGSPFIACACCNGVDDDNKVSDKARDVNNLKALFCFLLSLSLLLFVTFVTPDDDDDVDDDDDDDEDEE